MYERHVEVGSKSGLHARPAATFVQAANKLPHRVEMRRPGGDRIDTRSILSVLSLHVGSGEEVILSTEDPAAVDSLDELARLLAGDLDEGA
jgi:phosphocarrier protein